VTWQLRKVLCASIELKLKVFIYGVISVVACIQVINRYKENKMFHYIYKITNKTNGKIYVGVHSTHDMNDGYMGSGKLILNAIKKYGRDSFTKDILEIFDKAEDAFLREREIVNEDFIRRSDTYNLGFGGSGGTIFQNRKAFTGNHSKETKDKIRNSNLGKQVSQETRKKLSENNFAKRNPDKQKKHAKYAAQQSHKNRIVNVEYKKKISESLKMLNDENRKNGIAHPVKGIKRKKVVCPHCQKEGAMNTMKRFHFDNCKFTESLV